MNDSNEVTVDAGDEVVRAVGELSATTESAAQTAKEAGVDFEQVGAWLTTIFKAIIRALKP